MEYIKTFQQLSKSDAAVAGGKGASLGEMTQIGLPVPPGFVVLAKTFDRFLEETDLGVEVAAAFSNINKNDIASIEHASEKIQALILNSQMPEDIIKEINASFDILGAEFVAVRSSATAEDSSDASWAGELESYLNITKKDLTGAVKKCWASLFTPRAIFYRFEKEMHKEHVAVAVVVQKMVQSEVSGITFTVHPVTEDCNQMVIESGYGLGEAIVGGMITPDTYVINKSKVESEKLKAIEDKNISRQEMMIVRSVDGNKEKAVETARQELQKISDEQIIELSKVCINIEKHYGFPCDIEWACEEGKFYIVQSRPITTISCKNGFLSKQTFIKAYTRNFSIIMQEAWFAANKIGLIEKLNLREYPFDPPYIYFMQDGVEEVWENTRANNWLLDRLVEKFKSDGDFFPELYKRYFKQLKEIELWWEKDIDNIDDLKLFVDKVYAQIADFVVIYAALMDSAVPQEYQDLASKMREKDILFAECNIAITKALNKIYPDLGHLVCYITKEELGLVINREELEKRDKGFVLIPEIHQGAMSFTEVISKFPEYSFQIEKGEREGNWLKGQVAYKGKARGVVRIVKRKDHANQVQNNDIIVSPMTTPDFMMAMQKAAAFVTDEGGLTCHAAILARELGKPCIIGTKIATQILKDGDFVEVDADNGIVYVLGEFNIGHYEDYQRLFQWRGGGLPYLISDIFMGHYRTLDGLVISKDGIWTNFLPKKKMEETLDDGLERLSSFKKFEKYKNDFVDYQKECAKFLDCIIRKQDITQQELKRALDFFVKLFFFYSKTEFFYVDRAFEYLSGNEIIKKNIDSFDVVKNGGRIFLNKLFLGSESYIEKILTILADKFSVKIDDLKFYGMEELNFLFADQKVKEDILSKRKNAFILRTNESKVESSYGDVAADIIENFLHEAMAENVEGLKGTVANKGKVKGKVFIIDSDYRNFHKISEVIDGMNQNDILVSDTTAPEIMMACKKAAAILTNQGGLMSHAAIVSRELEIPCIVGLGNITDVISNGDMVEVDAERGVVRILGKRNE